MVGALLLVADVVCIHQTIEMREKLGTAFLIPAITAQIASALAIGFLGLLVFRKSYLRQKKPASRQSAFALVQPLRRLFVSAWS